MPSFICCFDMMLRFLMHVHLLCFQSIIAYCTYLGKSETFLESLRSFQRSLAAQLLLHAFVLEYLLILNSVEHVGHDLMTSSKPSLRLHLLLQALEQNLVRSFAIRRDL